uniref:Phospholipid transfer protein n=2 Tax=Bos TaxID=9903 RepID=A0AAA9SDZ7_BOVIN
MTPAIPTPSPGPLAMALFGALILALLAGAHAELPGCKIRITSKALELVKQEGLRFLEQELETVTIPDLRGSEGHFFYNISEKVYEFLSTFITSGMRFLLNQQICPVLYHAGTVLLNSLLDTVPVRSAVDELVGIDYSLLKDPVASTSNLDMEFRGAFYPLTEANWSLSNRAVEPQLQEEERMVYVAFSEFFFDSAMESYFRAGALKLSLVGDKVPHDLDMVLRASYFGSIVLMSPAVIDSPLKLELRVMEPPRCTIKPSGTTVSVTASVTIALVPPNQPEVQLSSMIMDARLSAKMALRGKALRTQLDLRRFRIYSNQSALESLALIPLQTPLKTLLQIAVMPMLNERTWRGVQIPLPEGIDFVREVVTNHAGFLTIGADLHFAKGLREVIEKNRPADTRDPRTSSAPPPSTAAV